MSGNAAHTYFLDKKRNSIESIPEHTRHHTGPSQEAYLELYFLLEGELKDCVHQVIRYRKELWQIDQYRT